jgi:formate dehydrogenase subunit gamma
MADVTAPHAEAAAAICGRHGNDPAALVEILHDLQDAVGFVPDDAVPAIARALNLGKAEVHGVASFYHDFRSAPAGRTVVRVCQAEACRSMGAADLMARLCARHGVAPGGTTDDGAVTVEAVYCLGNCALAPAAAVGGRLIGRATAERLP